MTRDQIIETIRGALRDYEADSPPHWRLFDAEATAVLSALKAAGLAVVPVEPTEAMIDAAISADRPPLRKVTVGNVLRAQWAAMITSAQREQKP